MKAIQPEIISAHDYKTVQLGAGFGTRPQAVVMHPRGRRQFLIKSWQRGVGELRSEVFASSVGKLFGFTVQEVTLCTLEPDFFKELKKQAAYDGKIEAVKIKIDVRRQRESGRGLVDLETMLHGTDLINAAIPGFSDLDEKKRRKGCRLDYIEKAFDLFEKKHPHAQKKLRYQFFEMCVFDAIIGGTDRHDMNWGVLVSVMDDQFLRMVKYYDNGISMLWDIDLRPSERKGKILFSHQKEIYSDESPSMIKGFSGEPLTLFKLCAILIAEGYCTKDQAYELAARIKAANSPVRLKHAIIDLVPKNKAFETTPDILGWIYDYVQTRISKVIDILEKT